MALKIVTGGTTGAADGTLVSSGNPLVIVALNTAVNAHIRCDDGYWSNDQAFDVPAELEVSFDGGSTWYGNADEPITAPEIYAVNYPIKLRQIVAASTSAGTFTTDGTYTACTALADVTGFTATAGGGSGQLAVAWTAVTNRTRYQVDRATNSGFTTGVTLGVYAGTSTSFTDTGLTNGTTYYYRIKAVGTYRYKDSASYATANAAPTPGSQAAYDTLLATFTPRHNWKLTEASGSSFADSGSQNIALAGTSISAAGATGPDGLVKAVQHPGGSGKYVASASALQLNGITSYTWIVWFKAATWTASGTKAVIAELIDAGASTSYLQFGKDVLGADTLAYSSLMNGVTTSVNWEAAKPSASVWHMAAIVIDPTQSGAAKIKVYIDGSVVTNTTGTPIVGSPDGNLTNNDKLSLLARGVPFGTAGAFPFDGAVSNVAFVPSALSAANVLALKQAMVG